MEQKNMGSVQPFGGFSTWHHIAGAALKYCDTPQYYEQLIEYIQKLINKEKEKLYE